jgi:SNF2 family DNA or RNA helicase
MYGFHVVLTSYEYLMGKADRPRLSNIPWSYIIVDEGHRLKNAACKLNGELRAYSAAHRLLLTGTPLQNNLNELWALLNFLMPSLFGSSEDFATWFGGADKTKTSRAERGGGEDPGNDGNESADDELDDARHADMLSEEETLIVTSRLHQVLRPFMLRRLKESVAGELPTKTERLLACAPSPYQQGLFAALEARLGAPGGVRGVSNTLMELRTICNHPLITRLHQDGAEHSMLPPHPLPPEIRLSSKLEILDRILLKLKAANHRVLIFCTMTRLLDVLESHLEWRGLRFLRLDGSTNAADRGRLVDDFNATGSPYFAFLLSVRAGGVGLNLQSADTVIFYDTDWNSQVDSQAAARAHRIGQTREVLILRLQTKGTVEERVVAVAEDKRGMVDRSITGGFFDGRTGAAERQRYLLSLLREQAASRQQEVNNQGSEAERDSQAAAGSMADDELNRLIARGDHELELFQAEDKRRAAAEIASWSRFIKSSTSKKGPDDFSRLATADDVKLLVEAVNVALAPKNPDEGKEFGRGKRARGFVAYLS